MYRTVVCACVALVLFVESAPAKEPKEIFNGKDLKGWDGDKEVWSVEDGAIVGRTKEGQLKDNTFLIWRGGDVGDFKLTFQYRIDGGNSGVQYRSKVIDKEKWIVGGYQADIDSGPRYSGILYDERGRGILAERGQRVTYSRQGGEPKKEPFGEAAELQKNIKSDDWNDYEIEVRGARMKHTINGKLMSETVDRDPKQVRKGVLALQVHKGPPMTVKFRKIKLEELEPRAGRRNRTAKSE